VRIIYIDIIDFIFGCKECIVLIIKRNNDCLFARV
jgi:hypothetical protein